MRGGRCSRVRSAGALFAVAMLAIVAASCGVLSPESGVSVSPEDSGQLNANIVSIRDLPPEARETLELIEKNGPFPYSKDGSIFHNFEGLLPEQPDGYYREYTVVTPGSSDRGARRIVTGENGERYYTDDHYASFRLVVE
ncbi:MAG: ribonuclease N [Dehalococcoidia bacterium]|nr:ribonuclease N [Dehalococcoidia bacterium]